MHYCNSSSYIMQLRVKAQLFSVLNDTGKVIYHKIVPDGSHTHVKEAIGKIVAQQQHPVFTKCLYTDKAVADQNLGPEFTKLYYKKYKKVIATVVLQGMSDYTTYFNKLDLYHVKQRVLSLLPVSHPDYHSAKKQFNDIFTELVKQNTTLKNKEDLAKYAIIITAHNVTT